MTEEKMRLVTAKEAAEYLRVSMFTLNKIQRESGLVPYRTPGGHRRYSLGMLNRYLDNSRRERFHKKSVDDNGEGNAIEMGPPPAKRD